MAEGSFTGLYWQVLYEDGGMLVYLQQVPESFFSLKNENEKSISFNSYTDDWYSMFYSCNNEL